MVVPGGGDRLPPFLDRVGLHGAHTFNLGTPQKIHGQICIEVKIQTHNTWIALLDLQFITKARRKSKSLSICHF